MSRILDSGTQINAGVFFAAPRDLTSIMSTVRHSMTDYAKIVGIPEDENGVPQLAALHDTEEDVLAAIKQGKVIVCRRNWQIVGTACLDRTDNGDICYLRRFAVLSEYRGSGIGKLIFELAAEHLWETGCKEIRLFTAYQHRQLIRFYEKLGFEIMSVDDSGPYPRATLVYRLTDKDRSHSNLR